MKEQARARAEKYKQNKSGRKSQTKTDSSQYYESGEVVVDFNRGYPTQSGQINDSITFDMSRQIPDEPNESRGVRDKAIKKKKRQS